ncbi:MAG TPA: ATP-dependent DNA helicase, partial [Acetobacteraceae bacterium]
MIQPSSSAAQLILPKAAALVAGHQCAVLLSADGEVLTLTQSEAADYLAGCGPPLIVHAPASFRRLGVRPVACFDLLELFAFALPARSAVPTPRGLCIALELDQPAGGLEAEAACLGDIAAVILRRLGAGRELPMNRDAAGLAAQMGRAGWGWAPFVTAALGRPDAAPSAEPLKVWKRLPEWEETAPLPPPSSHPIGDRDARARLAGILGPDAEQRPGQSDYAGAASAAFAPREARGDPHLVLAEAGTGIGKTLGYIAPASLWAEKNRGAVWISTFTRHLQRQIDAELARLFPDPAQRRHHVVVRKGRENYLCLLNLEDAVGPSMTGFMPGSVIPLGLVARWALATTNGDIQGGDLPGWMAELFGAGTFLALADRRGECIHAGCPHWRRCFIEHTVRRARSAQLVVANHALVMTQAAWGGLDDAIVPTRYVFDEGHHLFEAADAAFAAVLSGLETAELRRWLLGAEGGRSRARGLRRRLDELVAGHAPLETMLDAALQAAGALPAPGWTSRLSQDGPELAGLDAGRPNPTEAVLRLFRRQVLARAAGDALPPRGPLECDLLPAPAELQLAAERLARALTRIAEPLSLLRDRMAARLEDEADELDSATRSRIEAVCRSITRRALAPLSAWRAMLRDLVEPPPEPGTRPDHIMFLRLDRRDGTDRDAGLHRHWLDPTVAFAMTVAAPAHGLLVTSATLRDSGDIDPESAWAAAEARVGAPHLPSPAIRAALPSPFDYANQTRAFVVTDVPPGQIGALAAAYRALFLAAGGGALGLFPAISRLLAVHQRIAPELEAAGLPL